MLKNLCDFFPRYSRVLIFWPPHTLVDSSSLLSPVPRFQSQPTMWFSGVQRHLAASLASWKMDGPSFIETQHCSLCPSRLNLIKTVSPEGTEAWRGLATCSILIHPQWLFSRGPWAGTKVFLFFVCLFAVIVFKYFVWRWHPMATKGVGDI